MFKGVIVREVYPYIDALHPICVLFCLALTSERLGLRGTLVCCVFQPVLARCRQLPPTHGETDHSDEEARVFVADLPGSWYRKAGI